MDQPYQQLELDWAEWSQLDPAGMVCCASGSSALHLSLEAMRLPQCSEVVVPDLCMIAVPRAVTLAGLTPVFVDCDDTLNMDFPLLYKRWDHINTAKVRGITAVVAVHTYGKQCDMNVIHRFCSPNMQGSNGLKVTEDLAEAHGLKPHRHTDAACWSFYRNKIVAGEEGGAVWFRDPEHAKLARQLRSLGFTDAHDFMHVPRGHNYRMSNVHASLILDSLRRVDLSLENRWSQWHTYNELCPKEWRMQRPDAPWMFAFKTPALSWSKQLEVCQAVDGARCCFKPCHIQEEYQDAKFVYGSAGHKSSLLSSWTMYLPLSSYSTRCHLDAFDVIQRILDR